MTLNTTATNLSQLTNPVNARRPITPQIPFSEHIRGNYLNAPYSYLADRNGQIHHNGITFALNEEWNSICLGDMSDQRECINIPLENGGLLKVNKSNFADLAKAIDLFSAKDRGAIMRAISFETHIQKLKHQIEDDEAEELLTNINDGSAQQEIIDEQEQNSLLNMFNAAISMTSGSRPAWF